MPDSIPTKFVVYYLRAHDGRLMYVGSSTEHRRRWLAHWRAGRIGSWLRRREADGKRGHFSVFCYCGTYTEMLEVERMLIERFRPMFNTHHTGRATRRGELRQQERDAASAIRLIEQARELAQLHTVTGRELEHRVQRRRSGRGGPGGQQGA